MTYRVRALRRNGGILYHGRDREVACHVFDYAKVSRILEQYIPDDDNWQLIASIEYGGTL